MVQMSPSQDSASRRSSSFPSTYAADQILEKARPGCVEVLGYNEGVQLSPEAKRLRTAFDLFEAGVRMMQARFRRSRPHASPAEIEDLLTAWILERPGAPLGDVAGKTAPRPTLQ